MKLLVCIKQVPDLESRLTPDSAGVWFTETDPASRQGGRSGDQEYKGVQKCQGL